jgi:hypothetical protein
MFTPIAPWAVRQISVAATAAAGTMMNANRFHLTRPGVNPAPDCAVWDMALLRDIPWCGGGGSRSAPLTAGCRMGHIHAR